MFNWASASAIKKESALSQPPAGGRLAISARSVARSSSLRFDLLTETPLFLVTGGFEFFGGG